MTSGWLLQRTEQLFGDVQAVGGGGYELAAATGN